MTLAERAIRAGFRLNSFETLGSTNDEALTRARQGDRGKLWIVASRQTKGRGRQGRDWRSPAGNLYASLLLIDPAPPALAPQVGFVAGVALATAIADCAKPQVQARIKWPNDIVHDGAKLAGILVEGSRGPDGRFACVIGCGVNCLSHPTDLPYPTSDLLSIGTMDIKVGDVLAALSGRMDEWLSIWDRGRGFARLRERWLELALPTGTPMSVATAGRRSEGLFSTIDELGRLQLSTPQGVTTIDAGDVFLLDRPVQPTG